MSDERKTISISEKAHRKLRLEAAETGSSIKAIVEEMIEKREKKKDEKDDG